MTAAFPADWRPGQVGSWECQLWPPSVVARITARAALPVPTTQPRVVLAKLTEDGEIVDSVVCGMPVSCCSRPPAWVISTAPVASAAGVGLSRTARLGSITENGPGELPGPAGRPSREPRVPGSPRTPRQWAPPSPVVYSA